MGEIETSNRQVTLYYNSKSEKDKKILATAQAKGYAVIEIDLQKTELTGTQIVELADRLNVPVKELVNQEHATYKTKFENHDYSTDDWIKMIQNNPEILRHPIALRGPRTKFVKTSTDILDL
ncbi:MAG TPA: ArsC/Spx/MgsR family protein [Cryomorphaceae bacterium]|nr:ArsC/Spx/MgsR family protein [Cryomorphaceae bacterium]